MRIKMKKKIIGTLIVLALFLSISASLWAEDYPMGYLPAGYREYLLLKKQEGYFVEQFTKIDLRNKERVNKRNQLEEILGYSYQAAPVSANGILITEYQQKYNTAELKRDIIQQRQEREKVASANIEGGFTYIPYSDGKIEYFKDGLVTRIENERVIDEFGNVVGIKNTDNMKYNDKRLLTSYEATLKDNLGNLTKLSWYGATYSDDSLFYGGPKTNANRNLTEYYLKEIDSSGNVKLTHWKAGSYEGKFLRAFSQTIEDSISGNASFSRSHINYATGDPTRMTSYHEEGMGTDNLAYTLDRTNITYNGKGQTASYHEETLATQVDGKKLKTTTDVQFKYIDPAQKFGPDAEPDHPDRLSQSIVTTTIENPDGSIKTETATNTYNYGSDGQLMSASGTNQFSGYEAKWYEYKDAAGQVLSRNVDKDNENKVSYSYVDPDTLETITVSEDQVTASLKDGKKFSGTTTSEVQYEILYGKSVAKEAHYVTKYYNPEDNSVNKIEDSTIKYKNGLVNNLLRALGIDESVITSYPLLDSGNTHTTTTKINTTYIYDDKGNLADVQGSGTGNGWEYSGEKGWSGKYTSTISIDYEVILGRAVRTTYNEHRISQSENSNDNASTDKDEIIPIKMTIDTTTKAEYEYNAYGVAIAYTETTTTVSDTTSKTKQEDETYKEETSSTTAVYTTKSTYRDGGLKVKSTEGTSLTTASDESSSTTDSWTNYEYDDQGQLRSVSGGQDSEGNRGKDDAGKELGTFTSKTVDNYIIQDGQALKSSSVIAGTNKGSDGKKESDFTETLTYEYELKGVSWELIKEINHSETNGVDGGATVIDAVKTYQKDANGIITGITQTATGTYKAVGDSGGTQTYTMQNYQAEFKFDAKMGWYLAKESYDWEVSA